jgi:hypothetical protein
MAGRPRRSFRRGFKSKRIPLLPLIGVAGTTLIPALFGGGDYAGAINAAQTGGIGEGVKEFIDVLSIQTTGYKPSDGSNWGWTKPTTTWTTIILSMLGHYAMNKLGVNRSIAKIPMVGKYIAL